MKLSVIIVTWNSTDDIETCIASLRFRGSSKTTVVDNASTDTTIKKLASFPSINLIANHHNLGYAHANNQGIEAAQGEYILLLNPDTCLKPDALDILAEYLDEHPDVGAVAPKLLNPDGSVQHSIRSFPTTSSVFWELFGLSRLFQQSHRFGRWRMAYFDYDNPGEVEQPMTSCMMVRRSIFEELGGLDECFPIFYNDVDFSLRMHTAGWKTVYLPQAQVFHRRGASTNQIKPKMIWESHHSLFHFLRKHDNSRLFWLKAMLLIPLLEFAALIRVLAYRLRPRSN